ncbi:hypothetical protein RJ639_017505, partial [Escallonia herrerae]
YQPQLKPLFLVTRLLYTPTKAFSANTLSSISPTTVSWTYPHFPSPFVSTTPPLMHSPWVAHGPPAVRLVIENATLTFGVDRNLVLTEVDGTVAWQTVGQALRATGPNELVSRLTAIATSNGPYSYVVEQSHSAISEPEYEGSNAFELRFGYDMKNSPSIGTYILSRPKYNSTYSMLRVDIDSNLRRSTRMSQTLIGVRGKSRMRYLTATNGVRASANCRGGVGRGACARITNARGVP